MELDETRKNVKQGEVSQNQEDKYSMYMLLYNGQKFLRSRRQTIYPLSKEVDGEIGSLPVGEVDSYELTG